MTKTRNDRTILIASLPAPVRRVGGFALLGLTLWLSSLIALFV